MPALLFSWRRPSTRLCRGNRAYPTWGLIWRKHGTGIREPGNWVRLRRSANSTHSPAIDGDRGTSGREVEDPPHFGSAVPLVARPVDGRIVHVFQDMTRADPFSPII